MRLRCPGEVKVTFSGLRLVRPTLEGAERVRRPSPSVSSLFKRGGFSGINKLERVARTWRIGGGQLAGRREKAPHWAVGAEG